MVSQDYIPEFCEYKYQLTRTCWAFDKLEDRVDHWENGNVLIEYETVNDSIKLRRQYYESGNLKFTCVVYQEPTIDTSYTEDPDTGLLEIAEICDGFKDIPNGIYQEFRDQQSIDIIATGYFNEGIMVGLWEKQDEVLGYVTGIFDQEGYLAGEFKVYYYDTQHIKLQGQYSVFEEEYPSIDPDTGERITIWRKRSEKTGTWVRFDYEGDSLQTIEYQWIKK